MTDPAPEPRVHALDLARFVAIFGMVVIDMVMVTFFGPMPDEVPPDGFEGAPVSEEGGPEELGPPGGFEGDLGGDLDGEFEGDFDGEFEDDFDGDFGFGDADHPVLSFLWEMWWGRASALFVVVAGLGLALMFPRREGGPKRKWKRGLIYRRALFLFVVGHVWNSCSIWPVSILHFYSFFLVVGCLCVTLERRWFLPLAAGCAVLYSGMTLAFGQDQGIPTFFDQPYFWQAEFWSLRDHVILYFYSGTYPAVAWFAFVLIGLWLGRLPRDDAKLWGKVVLGSAAVLVATLVVDHLGGDLERGTARDFLTIDRSWPLPLYLASAGSQASLIIGFCMLLPNAWGDRAWMKPLLDTGRISFTIYIVRIFIGGGMNDDVTSLFDLVGFPGEDIVDGWLRVAVFMPVTILLCHLWLKRFRHGPLEGAMRWFSDRKPPPEPAG